MGWLLIVGPVVVAFVVLMILVGKGVSKAIEYEESMLEPLPDDAKSEAANDPVF